MKLFLDTVLPDVSGAHPEAGMAAVLRTASAIAEIYKRSDNGEAYHPEFRSEDGVLFRFANIAKKLCAA